MLGSSFWFLPLGERTHSNCLQAKTEGQEASDEMGGSKEKEYVEDEINILSKRIIRNRGRKHKFQQESGKCK